MTKEEYKEIITHEVFRNNKNCINKLVNKYINPSTASVYMIRKMQYYYSRGKFYKIFSHVINKRLNTKYGIFISPDAVIGEGFHLPHPVGIIIGCAVHLGTNCSVYQNVTIGGKNIGSAKLGLHPEIGNDCIIFAGAKVIGNIHITDKVTVGANAVVVNDCLESGTYVGIPAKYIKKEK